MLTFMILCGEKNFNDNGPKGSHTEIFTDTPSFSLIFRFINFINDKNFLNQIKLPFIFVALSLFIESKKLRIYAL